MKTGINDSIECKNVQYTLYTLCSTLVLWPIIRIHTFYEIVQMLKTTESIVCCTL